MSRMQPNIAQDADPGDTNSARRSFYCRCKDMMRAMPSDLDAGTRYVLLTLFMHANDDGGGIFLGNAALCELTGFPRSTLFRHLATLARRGYVLPDGCQVHASGARTRRRRLDLVALRVDRTDPAAATVETPAPAPAAPSPIESPTAATSLAVESPTHGTCESPMGGTQTKRVNQEKEYQSLRAWRPDGRLGSAQARKILWGEGVQLMQELTGRREHQARGLVGELIRLAGRRPQQVVEAMQAQ